MEGDLIPLHRLPLKSAAQVKRLEAEGITRRRMLDFGECQHRGDDSVNPLR